MGLRIQMWLLMALQKRQELKQPHHCSDCQADSVPFYRMSILNIVAYFLLGVAAGIFFKVWIGIILTLMLLFINAKIIKKQCSKCLSPNITHLFVSKIDNKIDNKSEA